MATAPPSAAARWSLQGQTALITGGTKGIGRGAVEEFARLGAAVFTCARSEEEVEESLQHWRAAGLGAVAGAACDVSVRESRIELMDKVAAHFGGRLDILINNVGKPTMVACEDSTEEQFHDSLSVNVTSALHLSQLAHPLLRASGRASIIFTSSIASLEPMAFAPSSIYCMAKAAVNQLARSLAKEWAQDGIRVNCIAPGVIQSNLTKQYLKIDEVEKAILKEIPLGRTGEPQDVAAVMAFYCMPCASFCTGDTFLVDGGMSVRGVLRSMLP